MSHTCHAIGCTAVVPPKLFMCRKHWFMITPSMRTQIWRYYRPGQEIDKEPSAEYLAAAAHAIEYLAKKEQRLKMGQPS